MAIKASTTTKLLIPALSVHQPWAHWIASGAKKVENRPRAFKIRGPMLIHASANRRLVGDGSDLDVPVDKLAFGAVVCIVDVVDWIVVDDGLPSDPSLQWLETHEFVEGPTCAVWNESFQLREPVSCPGAQGFWRPSDDVMAKVFAQCDAKWQSLLELKDPSLSRFRQSAKAAGRSKRK